MIVALASILPGTDVDRLWEMGVDESMHYLDAAAALRQAAAEGPRKAAGGRYRPGRAGRSAGGVRGGLEALRPFLR